MAIRECLRTEKFNALSKYHTSSVFSSRGRAALAYVEEAMRHKHVSDATFQKPQKDFSEREIVEIT